ncbi:MAG: phosphate signaling complex protein PhoU [Polyangiaceae bacterium]|nr:phosphate signaling complex protein PhoU [Polyangiaceae bacterium]MCE7890849.1 phosphate transport system regulatory protein PhoU [Sorangiineae bacterium PRO1]MCL4750822.1 phosphate signaling complex protein PhoU [Myxococcales bacterium]
MTSLQRHTDREYEAELEKLREQVLLMGARTEELLAQAMRAFSERDAELARLTIRIDNQIDQLELDIDQLCLKILARRQPVASDLRFITTTMKLVTDLERMGDLGVNVCERVIELAAEPPLPATTSVTRIAEAALAMLHDALDAFVAGNTEAAEEVIERDGQVDAYYAQLFPELLQLMMKDSDSVFRATRLQSIAKYLERIADHATNIAEMVVFMVRGKDVRHAFALSRGDG